MNRPTIFAQGAALILLLVLAGCSKEEKPAETAKAPAAQPAAGGSSNTASQPASSSQPAAGPMAGQNVLASAQYGEDPDLRADLLEVKRNSGGSVTVRWRLVNTAGSGQSGLVAGKPKSIHYDFSWDDIYFIDPAENKKYNFLKDAEGKRIIEVWYGYLEAGQQRGNWAKFPAPPPTSKKITINIPKFPPFEDVPVAE